MFFLFLKRRQRKQFVNQSPDFNDTGSSQDLSEKGFGFKKLFGSKVPSSEATAIGGAGVGSLGYNELQDEHIDGESHSDDFVYRGVTNNNNLDSAFKSLATNSSGQNTNTNGNTRHHSRYNSLAVVGGETGTPSTNTTAAPPYPISQSGDSVKDFNFQPHPSERQEFENPYDNQEHHDFNPSDYEDIEEEHLIPPPSTGFFLNEIESKSSRNSRSRFTEDI